MQGFNMGRYVPPDLEGIKTFNQASGKRTSSASSPPTIRFECPFAIWCSHCTPPQIIAQGVRFNATKTKVGNYFSTPIWAFRFKHTVCGGWIEVRTDPARAEYVVVSGGRRREIDVVTAFEGRGEILGGRDEERDRDGEEDAFGSLERKVEVKGVIRSEEVRLIELRKRRERDWADPYEVNKKVRREFRAGRRERRAQEESGVELQEKYGLGVDMVAAKGEDGERASSIRFGAVDERDVNSRGIWDGEESVPVGVKMRKDGGKRGKTDGKNTAKELLRDTLKNNTRGRVDPFLTGIAGSARRMPILLPRDGVRVDRPTKTDETEAMTAGAIGLVKYDSDSD